MTTVFVHYKNQYFYEICKEYFKINGYEMVHLPPADIVIIDLDSHIPYPDSCGAKLTILMSARVMFYWREKLPPHDLFWEKPIDIWYRLGTITDYIKEGFSQVPCKEIRFNGRKEKQNTIRQAISGRTYRRRASRHHCGYYGLPL